MGRVVLLVALCFSPLSARAEWLGVAASHEDRDGPIALWSTTELRVSADDGASFTSWPMPVTNVRSVLVLADGSVLVLGGTELGAHTLLRRVRADGVVEVLDAPAWISTVAARGDRVVALLAEEGALATLAPDGSWSTRPLPPWFDPATCAAGLSDAEAAEAECVDGRSASSQATMAIDPDGTVHLVDVEVSTCGRIDVLEWARIVTVTAEGATGTQRPHLSPTDPIYPTRWAAAWHGWVYALDEDGGLAGLVHGQARAIAGPRGTERAGGSTLLLVSNGALTVAEVGDALVRLDGLRATPLTTLPSDVVLGDVDARGRVLAVGPAGAVRWSRRSGWQALGASSALP